MRAGRAWPRRRHPARWRRTRPAPRRREASAGQAPPSKIPWRAAREQVWKNKPNKQWTRSRSRSFLGGGTYAPFLFRCLQGLAGWFGGGGNSRDKGGNRRNKGAISQGGRCGHFGGMYILQEMTMGVTKLENSLVEISQDIELDQRCPLGPPSRCFSLFTTPF